jgi:hypothetical protein
MVVSKIDGKAYSVKESYTDSQMAANLLSKLNIINQQVIHELGQKYDGTARETDIDFLTENYNGDVLEEHTPRTTKNTSYVLNKGDLIKICLRDPVTKKLHDFDTILFVNFHELSHMLDKQYGHNPSFWTSFKFILQEAEHMGLYKPIDYSKHPVKYCGIDITGNPYYD